MIGQTFQIGDEIPCVDAVPTTGEKKLTIENKMWGIEFTTRNAPSEFVAT
jgi:hypothetical protein